mgnify:CR=1 FL=1
MTNKKSAPLTPEESNKRDKQILDSLSEASMIDLANSILAEWKPYLNSEGETILGQEVSFNRAILLQLQRAVSTREETYRRLLVVSHEQTKQIVELKEKEQILKASNTNLQNRTLDLEKGYSDLCKGWDENKQLHLEIGTRQKKHVDTCDKNFLNIKEQIENLMRRF